ncbi:eukaryotic translation initiation factor 5 [Spiromyces aspiralis]|uniref:Eukaryotic translation initiation factor 5 n=1 Tax=Spiromyces aspiralis TaxID=68401 RepID=A0ACC1HRC4_9FUNG|nr:eukaryotic translation initiation factor 5 [Spiromyces aspiralis]
MTAQPGAEEGDAYSELTAYVQNNPDADDKAIYEKAKELDIHKKYRAMRAVIPELFTSKDVADVNKFIKDHSKLMVSFGTDSKHQKAIIDSFVAIIANHPELMGKTSNILMALYENDLVDEEEFLEWYEKKPSKKLGIDRDTAKQIVKQAGPFLKWLEEADEESDEESE